MKLLGRYFKERRRYLALGTGIFALFFVSFLFGRLPLAAVLYPAALALLLAGGFLAADFVAFRARHRELARRSALGSDGLDALPEAQNLIEADYQALLAALRQENAALAAASRERMDDMMDYYGTWAHQIKTPIAAMKLRLENEDSELGRALSGELLRIEQYADMVMAYLRLDSDSSDYVFRSLRVDDIVRPAIRRFAPQFIARHIRVEYEPVPDSVITDEKWLGFVVEQLLSNALKYSPDGAAVRVFMQPDRTLCISDEGIGIAPEDLPRVFEKGYTGANGRLDKHASGLGLYLCRRICDALGVGLAIQSTPGAGTTVCLDLRQRAMKTE